MTLRYSDPIESGNMVTQGPVYSSLGHATLSRNPFLVYSANVKDSENADR